MVRCKAVLLSLGLFGIIFFIQFSSYRKDTHQDIHQEKQEEGVLQQRILQQKILKQKIIQQKILQRQDLRKQLIREQCNGDRKAFSDGKNSLDDLSDEELKNFIVDDTNGIIYCYIPKVACTNWKRVMAILNHTEPYPDPITIDPESVHDPTKFSLLSSCSKIKMKMKLRHYTKFMFVRDPFIRLVSAYRDKFLQNNAYYYENFGRDIIRRYGNLPNPPKTEEEAFALGIHPSFHNFIQYLLDPKTEINEPFEPHWRQMYRLCLPCLVQYDFIGHQETLKEDAQELLKLLKLEKKIKFPPVYENVTVSNFVLNWFKTVPLEDRKRVYRLYREDFTLFGYQRPSELFDV